MLFALCSLGVRTFSWTGYRYYETCQLEDAAKIKAYRQLGLSIDEIKAILAGADVKETLGRKTTELEAQKEDIEVCLSIIKHLFERREKNMYQVTVKEIPAAIVYYAEATLPKYSDMMKWLPKASAPFF